MLQVISKKFLRFLPVLLIIVCGFPFIYYALLQNQKVYIAPILALMKTSLIMFQINSDDQIYNESPGGINYYPIIQLIFYLRYFFGILGLAVGEIPTLVQIKSVRK